MPNDVFVMNEITTSMYEQDRLKAKERETYSDLFGVSGEGVFFYREEKNTQFLLVLSGMKCAVIPQPCRRLCCVRGAAKRPGSALWELLY